MKVLTTIFLLACVSVSLAQEKRKAKKAHWENWSDSAAFYNGAEPLVLGYGPLSDTLSTIYDGKTFFEIKGRYYVINSLKDYYYWFTKKHPFLFRDSVERYEEFYELGNDFKMARFVKENFAGKRLPIKYKFWQGAYKNYSTDNTNGHEQVHQMPSVDYTPGGGKYQGRN